MKTDDYIVFILTHGRADNVVTYKTLLDQGYTGRVGFVIDDEDKQADKYRYNFGAENVFVFNKAKIAETFDEVHKADRRTVVYARNACFDIANELGIKYFIELDDDYGYFSFALDDDLRFVEHRYKNIKNLDNVFGIIFDFFLSIPAKSVAMAQAGDLIGGAGNVQEHKLLRKCMNSFFCSTDRPFKFTGRINEDVNTYTMEAHRGMLFFTTKQVYLNQGATQQTAGGMTDVYLESGTYIKSFFSVIVCPSAVKIGLMGGGFGGRHMRIHHNVTWNNCAPKIVSEDVRKHADSAR